jgi:hypothetical protein
MSEFYQSLGIQEKANNVLMLEFVATASPEFFKNKKPAEVEEWAKHQVDFFKKEFGDQVKMAVLHLDEKTPHLHFMIGTELNSVKKYKNQKGEFHKESWSINAKRYNPEFLVDLQDRYADHNKRFGLKRGVKGSMRKHKTLKEFYAVVDKALNTNYEKQIQETIESLETSFLSKQVSIDEIKKKFAPMLNTALKQNKALKEKFALDIKQWATDLKEREIELEAKAKKYEIQELKYTEIDRLRKETTEKDTAIQDLTLRIEELETKIKRQTGSANRPEFLKKA